MANPAQKEGLTFQLDHITTRSCPVCGEMPSSICKDQKHSNGHWNEKVVYQCGATVCFSPNFMRCIWDDVCPTALRLATDMMSAPAMHPGIVQVADALWKEIGGPDADHNTPYREVVSTVASFMSCLAEDIANPDYVVAETMNGLLNNFRRKFGG